MQLDLFICNSLGIFSSCGCFLVVAACPVLKEFLVQVKTVILRAVSNNSVTAVLRDVSQVTLFCISPNFVQCDLST